MSDQIATFKIKYPNEPDAFYRELSRKVKQYFQDTNQTRFANAAMIRKTFTQVGIVVFTYGLILSNKFHGLDLFVIQMFNGFFIFLMSIGIGHDGTHNAYSGNPKINKLVGSVMDFCGVDSHIWEFNHLDSHHAAPNVPLYDSAIDSFLLFRFHPKYPKKSFMRFQQYYIFLIYGVSTLFKWFYYDFFSAFRSRIGNETDVKSRMSNKNIMMLFLKKLFVYSYSLIIPIMVVDVPWYQYLAGFLCFHFISGIAIGVIFQVTHLSNRTDFFDPGVDGKLENSFSHHILKTTADFCPESHFWTWVSGGLNLHVAHHLFPGISQIHLPAITRIVKETAAEFGHDYCAFETPLEALKSHYQLLKYLGEYDEYRCGDIDEEINCPFLPS